MMASPSAAALLLLLLLFVLAAPTVAAAGLTAGAARVELTGFVGAPLAGYNHAERRVPMWPVPVFTRYTTFMTPSTGVMSPLYTRALVMTDAAGVSICLVSLDGIGSDGVLLKLAWDIAVDQGFTLPYESLVMGASHSHSAPGAVSSDFLWAMAPATDLLTPSLQELMATHMAKAMVAAQKGAVPAAIATGIADLPGVTVNRRAKESPYVNSDTIDPNLGVLRVDTTDGKPIAVLWNFAWHGTCYGPANMEASGDIMGHTNDLVEAELGVPSIFFNADAGDIDPSSESCANKPDFNGSHIVSAAILAERESLKVSDAVTLTVHAEAIDLGPTNLNLTLERMGDCKKHKREWDLCTLCDLMHCDANVHLPEAWIQQAPVFTAIRIDIDGVPTGIVTLPGEPLVEVGWMVRNVTKDLGFAKTFLFGYANAHIGYIASANEYEVGGYEGLLTFWGIDEAQHLVAALKRVASHVAPTAPPPVHRARPVRR